MSRVPVAPLLRSVAVTLSNSDILHLLSKPIPLLTPLPGTAILPVAGWAVCNFSHGIYLDPDAHEDIQVLEQVSNALWADLNVATDQNTPDPGAAMFFQAGSGGLGSTWILTSNDTLTNAPVLFPQGGPLVIQKNPKGASEFTGGGPGNSLKIILYYIAVPTS